MSLFERKPHSRLIFLRHLETPATEQRDTHLQKDEDYHTFSEIVSSLTTENLSKKQNLLRKFGRRLLSRYSMMPPDAKLPIQEGQERWGTAIGKVLTRRYHIDQIEQSPYLRTRQTTKLIQEGNEALKNVPILDNPQIRERSFGDADIYPFGRLYFVDHPDELRKFVANRSNYSYPNSESKEQFDVRMQHQAERYLTSEDYAHKTTLIVGHSMVHRRQIELLTNMSQNVSEEEAKKRLPIDTGSVTVLEERRRIFPGERRYKLIYSNEQIKASR